MNSPTNNSRTVAVIGTGLIGTSVALALRNQGIRTYLHDRNPAAAAAAAARGAGILGLPSTAVDLAVVAVPPAGIAAVLAEIQDKRLARAYTDVGSVKTAPLAEAEAMGCDLTTYLGGHPMAGGERSGPACARPDLFRDRNWVLTPLATTSAETLGTVIDVVRMTGARPIMMAHAEHDRIVARTSHVPHVIAAALAASLDSADDAMLGLCGAGIKDATRIAAGDTALWTQILRANATEVSKVLSEIAADLTAVSQALGSDVDAMTALLHRGNTGRALLIGEHRGADHG
ncbi:prephenate dehydrogenase [Nocardia altamirensis]|uniref:prephenate dehydrogenase n=1 Tax=Nocardia altamirensis TaxID=472158 RepID=UPI0008402FD1|nr:prephenate dehydrogenase [Nocardia altamirensis]